ncbi:MAG: hypothetical protein LQ349_003337 [Xanthoria aureola]|nr:MAG: hypothetical protein LQ349_003337 [Xanthoria aureola]
MSPTVIAEDGDFLLEVIEWDRGKPWINKEPIIRGTEVFKVSRNILMDSSQVFTSMLGGGWKEAHQSIITLKDWTILYMQIWLQVLHSVIPTSEVPIEAMWHMAKIADCYRFDVLKLKDWFAKWYQHQPISIWYAQYNTQDHSLPNPKWLLYPCYTFDHYQGLMQATKFCAYRYTHHIGEVNPTRFYDLHLPSRVIQQLNAAKGRLRTVLHRDLYEPNDKLLKARCTCKEKTLWGYEKALTVCGAWPLERVVQDLSMYGILSRLSRFTYPLPASACSSCHLDYEKIVQDGKVKTEKYFEGLCLDCMDASKADDEDHDYWSHGTPKEHDFVYGCRAKRHSQPTWYFSYMGRKQRRDKLYRGQKVARYGSDSE